MLFLCLIIFGYKQLGAATAHFQQGAQVMLIPSRHVKDSGVAGINIIKLHVHIGLVALVEGMGYRVNESLIGVIDQQFPEMSYIQATINLE